MEDPYYALMRNAYDHYEEATRVPEDKCRKVKKRFFIAPWSGVKKVNSKPPTPPPQKMSRMRLTSTGGGGDSLIRSTTVPLIKRSSSSANSDRPNVYMRQTSSEPTLTDLNRPSYATLQDILTYLIITHQCKSTLHAFVLGIGHFVKLNALLKALNKLLEDAVRWGEDQVNVRLVSLTQHIIKVWHPYFYDCPKLFTNLQILVSNFEYKFPNIGFVTTRTVDQLNTNTTHTTSNRSTSNKNLLWRSNPSSRGRKSSLPDLSKKSEGGACSAGLSEVEVGETMAMSTEAGHASMPDSIESMPGSPIMAKRRLVTTPTNLERKHTIPIMSLRSVSASEEEEYPDSICPSSSVHRLQDVDALEIARQLCLIDSELFRKLEISDFYHSQWTAPGAAGNITDIAQYNNNLTQWLKQEIFLLQSPEEQAAALIHCIHIGKHLLGFNNFNALLSIYLLFELHLPITGCKLWTSVPSPLLAVAHEIQTLMSPTSNFSALRARMSTCQGSFIPCAEVLLKDLLYATEGELDRSEETGQRLNFPKILCMGEIISKFINGQFQYILRKEEKTFQYLLSILVLTNNDDDEEEGTDTDSSSSSSS